VRGARKERSPRLTASLSSTRRMRKELKGRGSLLPEDPNLEKPGVHSMRILMRRYAQSPYRVYSTGTTKRQEQKGGCTSRNSMEAGPHGVPGIGIDSKRDFAGKPVTDE